MIVIISKSANGNHRQYAELTTAPNPGLNIFPSALVPLTILTDLYLDFQDGALAIPLWQALDSYSLKHLSVYKQVSHGPDRDWVLAKELFEMYSTTLESFTLLNAWGWYNSDHDVASEPWLSTMILQQVYLSDLASAYEDDDHRLNTLSHIIFRSLKGSDFWGPGIVHMRLGEVSLDDLEVDDIASGEQDFQHLRVLVIRASTQCGADHVTHALPHPQNPFGPTLPGCTHSLKEGQIARQITAQDLPSLRIIVFNGYKFWIQPATTKASTREIWFLRRALEDPEQEVLIADSVNQDDWKFLAEGGPCWPRCPNRGVDDMSHLIREASKRVYRQRSAVSKDQCDDSIGRLSSQSHALATTNQVDAAALSLPHLDYKKAT